MVKVWQKLFFDGRIVATDNVNPDFVMLAQAYGFEAFACDNMTDLPAAVDRFVNAKGPTLADFRTVPDICLPMVAPGKGLQEMFLPGTITFDDEVMPQMTGDAPS
jgi:acetolactate synthase-1/2/3 large subunit